MAQQQQQQPEWTSPSWSGERPQRLLSQSDAHNDSQEQSQLQPSDLARPETPNTPQLPEFPLPKQHATGPIALRTPTRDHARHLNQQPVSPTMQRRRSSSSFSNASILTNQLSPGLASVHPAPAYVGSFGATQVVSEHQAVLRRLSDGGGDDDAVDPVLSPNDDVAFSAPALALLNGFLDQLLFSFLAHARSTSLSELRPAVTDVLRPRLAGEAIASAEEELQELLGDGGQEEDDEATEASPQSPDGGDSSWDLELVWKRTRLRVMVYIRLGDMEDDDEERHVRDGDLAQGNSSSSSSAQRSARSSSLVSWAAAIFLTSVLEYVAEQVLQVAGQTALDRARTKARSAASPTSPAARTDGGGMGMTVEEYDMERVALNSGLSRLWRKWRKAQRTTANVAASPRTPTGRHARRHGSLGYTPASFVSPRRSSFGTARESLESRRDSLDTAQENPDDASNADLPEAEYPEHVIAANIPLPLADDKRDIDEIEVPGLARDPDESETSSTDAATPVPRRNSLGGSVLAWAAAALFGPKLLDNESSVQQERPTLSRQRSSSVPVHFRVPFTPAQSNEKADVVDEEAATKDMPGAFVEQPSIEEVEEVPEQTPEKTPTLEANQQSVTDAELSSTAQAKDSVETLIQQAPLTTAPTVSETNDRPASEELAETAFETGAATEVPVTNLTKEVQETEAGKEASEAKSDQITATHTTTAAGPESPPVTKDNSTESSLPRKPEDNDAAPAGGLLGGVVAGAAAVAAAAAATILPAAEEPKETEHAEEREASSMSNLQNQRPEAELSHAAGEPSTISAAQPVQPPADSTGDVKSQTIRQSPVDHLPVSQVVPEQTKNSDSLSGDTQLPKQVPNIEHTEPKADPTIGEIGVAQTSDTTMSSQTPAAVATAPVQGAGEASILQDKKPSPRRPANLVLGVTSSNLPPPSPVSRVSPLSQQDGQLSPAVLSEVSESRALSVSSHSPELEEKIPASPNAQMRFNPAVVSNRSSTQTAVSQSPTVEQTPHRTSAAIVTDKISRWSTSAKAPVPDPSSAVQEHPVVQRMASLKGNEHRLSSEEKSQPLTSASIKGPEDFDLFVQGGDTVKYTLTPENVRDEPTPTGQSFAKPTSRANGMTSSPVTATSPTDLRPGRSPSLKQGFVTALDPLAESESSTFTGMRENRRSVSRPSVRNTNANRKSGLMAREPRVMTESTRDFAAFIRSTGPDREQQPINLVASKSATSLNAQRSGPVVLTRSGSFGGVPMRTSNHATSQPGDTPPVPPVPSGKGRTSMQPRAATSISGGSGELIDFIRNGPSQTREHRISRSVAPFRSTMDSDQLNDWSEQLLSQPDFMVSAGDSTIQAKQSASSVISSNQASANSRSALLHTAIPTEPAAIGVVPESGDDRNEMPRHTYRNKDPYALPSDDEDDDFLMNLPAKRNEESLVDFLRNTEPPTDNAPRPIVKGTSTARTGGVNVGAPPSLGVDIVTTSRSKSLPGLQIATATRAQTGPLSAGPRQRLEARSPGTSDRDANRNSAIHNDTGDLAEFLRSSGPPPDVSLKSAPPRGAPAPNIGPQQSQAPLPQQQQQQQRHKLEKARGGRRSFFSGGLFSRSSKKS